jgi:hypothetical protein
VTANFGSNNVSVLIGDGHGNFGPKTGFGTGTGPYSVAIGNLSDDTHLDLVTANYGASTVSVLLNNGSGFFPTRTDYPTGSNPVSVAIGDLDRNGKPDLVTANYGAGTVSVLLSTGNGTFGAKNDFGTLAGPWSVAIGDLNGDTNPDVVTANAAGTVSVLLGDGHGSLGLQTDYPVGYSPLSVAIGDVNGDGKPDLVTANLNDWSVSVLLGNGDGTFRAKTDFGVGNAPYAVAIGDLNGDGKPDLATANYAANTVSVLLNTGDTSTPTVLALVDAHAVPGRVELGWFGASAAGMSATVYRQAEGADWTPVANIIGDGTGRLRFVDTNVAPGASYGYRLGVVEGGAERFYGETRVAVPSAWTLALAPPTPNPAAGRLTIGLTLPRSGAARVEVVDVAGRVVGRREVGALGPGQHIVTFAEAAGWKPGIYLVRLTQGQQSQIARACILR